MYLFYSEYFVEDCNYVEVVFFRFGVFSLFDIVVHYMTLVTCR